MSRNWISRMMNVCVYATRENLSVCLDIIERISIYMVYVFIP